MLNRSHPIIRKDRPILRSLLTLAALAGAMSLAPGAQATDRLVPSQYATIQAAITAAAAGDTVVVEAGTYHESLVWYNKDLTLRGAGQDQSIIDPSVANGGPGNWGILAEFLTSASHLEGFTVQNGTSGYGGGIQGYNNNMTITRCTFRNNSTPQSGGGVFNAGSSNPTVSECTFVGNYAGATGGGMNMLGVTSTVNNCVFIGNTAGHGAGLYIAASSTVAVVNCLFAGNTADYGGAVENGASSNTRLINCTIVNNRATQIGGAIYNYYTSAAITNSIFWGNSAVFAANDIANAAVVRYSILSSLSNTTPDIDGNFNADPLFVDAANGDFRLTGGSPCIDKGNDAVVAAPPFPTVAGVIVDLDGNPRTAGSAVDMGAYEGRGNTAPVAVDDAYTTDEDTVLQIAAPGMLANDTDADGDTLAVQIVSMPANGTLKLYAGGSFLYVPSANFHGIDSFTYKVNDGTADSNVATVTITVNSVNDAPVVKSFSLNLDEDTSVTFPLTGTDADNDPLTPRVTAGPFHGTITPNSDGTFTYTPEANYNGYDSFTYVVNDGTVDSNTGKVGILVNAVNDAPVATDDSYSMDQDTVLTVPAAGVLANDTDVEGDLLAALLMSGPAHGTLSLNTDGSFSYSPAAGYSGTDSFTYYVTDGLANSNTATVTITVKATAKDYSAQIASIQALEGQVRALITKRKLLPADGNSLLAKLDAAIAALNAQDPATAKIKLQDFINQVTSFIKTGKLTKAQGQPLIDAANAIIAQI